LELRGEIRGGRFVAGFTGEQFGLPEAIEALRSARRQPELGPQEISATDPLNLVGIVTPGERVPSVAGSHVVFEGGVPIGMGGNAGVLIPGGSSSRFPCG
jgi:ATP-dependent Lhr-like helicase